MESTTMDETAAAKKRRSGSENRRQNATFQMRMTAAQRAALDEAARQQGFRDAKELVMSRLEQDLASAGLSTAF